MAHTLFESQVVELTPEVPAGGSVCFDPDNIRLEGSYSDQILAYRARRIWTETLERCFLLDLSHDFEIKVITNTSEGGFTLRCGFLTACARYAFWRLTNQQAPEAQYLIETGHIPHCESQHDEFACAPDLRPIEEAPIKPLVDEPNEGNLRASVKSLIERIKRRLRH